MCSAEGKTFWCASRSFPRKRKPTVAHVLHSISVGGAELLAMRLARALQHSYRFHFLCLDEWGPLAEALREEGFSVHLLNRSPGLDWNCALRLAALVRSKKIEIIHAHQYTPFFYSALSRLYHGSACRLILTEHGRHYPDLVSRARRTANRILLCRVPDAVTAVCEFCARSLAERDGFRHERIQVIRNGVDPRPHQFQISKAECRARLGIPPERRYLLSVARLHPIKRLDVLVQAFCRVAALRPDVDFLLAGDGPARSELQGLATRLGVEARVRFLGARPDVPALLHAADLFVLTSECEAAPLSLLEALAAGLPAVATAVGGIPEMVRDGREALLVSPGDASGTARAILRILDDPLFQQRAAMAARIRIAQTYQLGVMVAQYDALYRKLHKRAPRPKAHCFRR